MAIKATKIQPAKTEAIEAAKKTLSEYNDFIFADYRDGAKCSRSMAGF